MPADGPLLSIAIPTFNRANYLNELLSELHIQLLDRPQIELLIADNASTDDTREVIERFRQKGLMLRYIRNNTNLGADGNFRVCFERAMGKYVWLLGDDDIVLPGAITKLLRLLANEDYALIYLCPYSFRKDHLEERTEDKFGRFAQRVPNGKPFIRKVGTSIAFMSAMIVNKDVWSSIERPDLCRLDATNLMHLGWLLPVLGSGGVDLIVWERLIAARTGNEGAWEIGRVFGQNLRTLTDLTLAHRKEIAAELTNNTLRVWFPLMISQIRRAAAGSLILDDVRNTLEPLHRRNCRYWIYVFPVATLPKLAALTWFSISQTINRACRMLELGLTYPWWRKDLIAASK